MNTKPYRRVAGTPGGVGPNAAAALIGVALLAGLPCVVALAVSVYLVADQDERHWREVALAAAAVAGAVVCVIMVVFGNPVGFHYSGFVSWWRSPSLSIGAIVGACLPAVPIGVPTGVALGACAVGLGETAAIGAEWHPLEQRRTRVDAKRVDAAVALAMADTNAQRRCSTPPLGVVRDGDLDSWTEGPYCVIGTKLGNRGVVMVGDPGSGKTETVSTLVSIKIGQGQTVTVFDGKATDVDLPYRLASLPGVRRFHLFPDQPLNGWLGTPAEISNRLIQSQEMSDPFYAAMTETIVRLAVAAPSGRGVGPCDCSRNFLDRLDIDWLAAVYRGTRHERAVAALRHNRNAVFGTVARFHGMFEAVNGGWDGHDSYDDSDITFLRVPTLAAPEDALAIARYAFADWAHRCTTLSRKPRTGADTTLVVDEASALTGLAPQMINIGERVRDSGGSICVTGQSYESLGRDDDERSRLRGALSGGIVLHRCANPEELLKAAGTVRRPEQSWQLDDTAHSGMGSMRMGFRMKIDPDAVRQAGVGEAWLISNGRYAHINVLRSALDTDAGRHLVDQSIERGRLERLATEQRDASATTTAEGPSESSTDPDWFDDLDSDGGSDE